MHLISKRYFAKAVSLATPAFMLAPVAYADSGNHGPLELFHLITSLHHGGVFWLAAVIAGGVGIALYSHHRHHSHRKLNRERIALRIRNTQEK